MSGTIGLFILATLRVSTPLSMAPTRGWALYRRNIARSLFCGFTVSACGPAFVSAVGIPSISAAYAGVRKPDLPTATTSLNIVQRLGGPTLTTLCATFLGWRLGAAHFSAGLTGAFTAAFLLLCVLHACLFAAALRLPLFIGKVTQRTPAVGAEVGKGEVVWGEKGAPHRQVARGTE